LSACARRSLLCIRPASAPVFLAHAAVILIAAAAVHLHHRWCRYRLHLRSVFAMVERWLGRTTNISPCDWASVTCTGCVAHPQLPTPARAIAPVPPRAWDLLHGRSIQYCLSLFFLSPHPQIVKSDGATPSVHAGVTVHTDLRSCAHPPPNSSPRSGYLYVLFFTFPSPFPFPHLPSIAFILSLVKLVFFSRLTVGAVSKALNAHHQFGLLFCRLLSIVCCFWCVGDTLLLCR
jgi:hypothetical protein